MNYVKKILERTVNLGIRDYGVCCRIDYIDRSYRCMARLPAEMVCYDQEQGR